MTDRATFANHTVDEARKNESVSLKLALLPMIYDSETLLWCITDRHVVAFCEANDEPPPSAAELERLHTMLIEDFDPFEILMEAMHYLRNGTRRFSP